MVAKRPGQSRWHNLDTQVCHRSEQDLPGRHGAHSSREASRRCLTRQGPGLPFQLGRSWRHHLLPRAVGLVLWSGSRSLGGPSQSGRELPCV